MNEQLVLELKDVEKFSNEELAEFARVHFQTLKSEKDEVREITDKAFVRAWAIGKACVTIGDRIGPEHFEEWAKEHIDQDYFALYRLTTIAEDSMEKPPLRSPARYKQIQIAFGDEPPPKTTPRRIDAHKFSNLVASCSAIQRWWKSGDSIKGLDAETLKEIAADLQPIVAIASAVNIALLNTEE